MRLARTLMLSIVAAGAGLGWTTTQVQAQSQWSGSTPVFQSDIEKRQRDLEAQREARRKSYGPTVYPKFMQGGERPGLRLESGDAGQAGVEQRPVGRHAVDRVGADVDHLDRPFRAQQRRQSVRRRRHVRPRCRPGRP